MVKGNPIPTPLQPHSIRPPLPLPPLSPPLPSPQLRSDGDLRTNIEQVNIHVHPEVVYLIEITNVFNRNDELKESGNSLNKSVLELNIDKQVALPSGSNLESIEIIHIKPALNDHGS